MAEPAPAQACGDQGALWVAQGAFDARHIASLVVCAAAGADV